ncbi:MAG: hypothetical protein U9R52_03575 [Candidatus Omnitrophota bacterium]|nr:hypothetical protein [Candidatus Omnitrophota bacterium]
MHRKRALILSIAILISAPLTSAQTYKSQNYTLTNPRIVSSGGKANSANYSITNVQIGNPFSGKAKSANYTLEAYPIHKGTPPNPPTIDPVTTPTNNPVQALTGTKDIAASIYINGYEKVPLDNETTWSCLVELAEGANTFIISSKNIYGRESESVVVNITLDTVPPSIVINNPLDGTIVNTSRISVEGTIDDVPFVEEKDLDFGLNPVSIQAFDEAGNISCENIEIYLARTPIEPPQ